MKTHFWTGIILSLIIILAGCAGGKVIPDKTAQAGPGQPEPAERPPRNPEPNYLALARDLMARGYYDVALVQLESALQIQSDEPEVHFLRGVCLRESDQSSEMGAAEAAFQRALELDPSYAAALDGLGLLHEIRGDKMAALASFEKAVALDPARADFQNNLGFSLLTDGRFKPAASHFKKSLALDPDDLTALNNLAICRGYQGRYEDALELLLNHHPLAAAYANMAALYRLLKQSEKAAVMDQKAQDCRSGPCPRK